MIEELDQPLRSATDTFPWPHVIRLVHYVRVPRAIQRKISRRALFARDGWRCVYCGTTRRPADARPRRPALEGRRVDLGERRHRRARRATCARANRLLEEVGMTLRSHAAPAGAGALHPARGAADPARLAAVPAALSAGNRHRPDERRDMSGSWRRTYAARTIREDTMKLSSIAALAAVLAVAAAFAAIGRPRRSARPATPGGRTITRHAATDRSAVPRTARCSASASRRDGCHRDGGRAPRTRRRRQASSRRCARRRRRADIQTSDVSLYPQT